jgi:hypothetical protein
MLLFITPLPTTLLEVAGKMGTESLELPLPYVQIWGQNWNIDVICVRIFMVSSVFICKLSSVGQKKIF